MRVFVFGLLAASLLCSTPASARPPAPNGTPDTVSTMKAPVMTEAEANKAACISTAQANAAISLNEQSTLMKHLIGVGTVITVGPHPDYSMYAKMNYAEMQAAINERNQATSRWMAVFCPNTVQTSP